MGLWIKENKHTLAGPVNGTSLIDDLHSKGASQIEGVHPADGLKRNAQGIVLVPQPSDDPRDPLNWPAWKRELCYLNIVYGTALVGAVGPLIAPGFVTIAAEMGVTVNAVAATNAACVLAIGVALFFTSAASIKWGRRPVYLAASVLMVAGVIWSAAKPDITNLLASRIVQGIAMAPLESTAVATIGDLYFVHQRGIRIAIWGMALLAGINVAPIVNGVIITRIGWAYSFWVFLPFAIIMLIGQILFLPETCYDRPHALELDAGAGTNEAVAYEHALDDKASDKQVDHPPTNFLPAKTVWQEMMPWSGYTSNENLLKIFIRPFPLLLSPTVMWGFLTYGVATILLILVSATSSVIFRTSYGFNAAQTGYISVSPLIASILMSLTAGYIADFLCLFMARRNKGVFEPEMRLSLMALYAVMVILGYGGWAASYRNKAHWMAPTFCYALVNGGQKFLSVASVTLLVDTHRKQTSEAQAIIQFLKNLISYFIGTKINGWILAVGVDNMFFILAGISAAIALTTIPMYRYGKITRSWVQRNEKLFLI